MDNLSSTSERPAARPLCHCLNVHADEVRQCIAMDGLSTVREVTVSCGAGGGCCACHRHIKRMLSEAAVERVLDATTPAFGFA